MVDARHASDGDTMHKLFSVIVPARREDAAFVVLALEDVLERGGPPQDSGEECPADLDRVATDPLLHEAEGLRRVRDEADDAAFVAA